MPPRIRGCLSKGRAESFVAVRGFLPRQWRAAQPLRRQREEGAGRRGGTQSNPPAHSRNRAAQWFGDLPRMGHRNSSTQRHDAGCLCLDGGGARGDTAVNRGTRTTEGFFGCKSAHPLRMTTLKAKRAEGLLGRRGDVGMTTLSGRAGHPPSSSATTGMAAAKTDERFFASLRMTTFLPRAAGRKSRSAARGAGARLLLFGIRFYQAIFAHLMPVGCKFYPSCSHYAAEAIERHGAGRGARLALARLWRCRPFTQGGFDPVPDADEVSNYAREAGSLSVHEAEGGARAEVRS